MDNVSEQKNCDNFDVFLLRKRHKKFQVSKIWKWSFQHENKLLLSYPCSKHANEILRSLTATRLKVKNLYTCTMKKKCIFAHFECAFFILVHDTVILCSFHDVKWPALQLFGPREHLVTIFNFSCLNRQLLNSSKTDLFKDWTKIGQIGHFQSAWVYQNSLHIPANTVRTTGTR